METSKPAPTQKERDDARCLARIRKHRALWIKAEARRRKRARERVTTHPKWRRAAALEAMKSWWMRGDSPEAALKNVRADLFAPVGDLPT